VPRVETRKLQIRLSVDPFCKDNIHNSRNSQASNEMEKSEVPRQQFAAGCGSYICTYVLVIDHSASSQVTRVFLASNYGSVLAHCI
jgi:hypothetical protein